MFPRPFGKYQLEREIARGGMATVFLATLQGAGGFEKKLVVKQVRDELSGDPSFIERFVREAKTAVSLNHPNIVPVFELGVEAGVYFIAMELVRGLSLSELIDSAKRRGESPFTPVQGAHIGAEMCRALDYAHRTGKVIHRDITPRNVMVDEEGQVKVIDFGIASKALALGEGIFGSPGHMPPEQMRGDPLDHRADIFSTAVLLMEVWSGKAPFRRASPEACEAAMQQVHPKPSDIHPELELLDTIVQQSMQLDPARRPESAAELGRAFRKFVQPNDTAEIARELGARVHAAYVIRESMRPPRMDEGEGGSGTATADHHASARKLETRTFAKRSQEFHAEALLTSAGPSTRRMDEDAPNSDSPVSDSERHKDSLTDEKVHVVGTLLPAKPSSNARPWPWLVAVAAGAAGIFSLATRAPKTDTSRPGAATQSIATNVPSSVLAPATVPTLVATTVAPTNSVSTPLPLLRVESAKPTSPSAGLPSTHSTASTTARNTAPSALSAVSTKPAMLTVLCSQGTVVLIDGAPKGACPLRALKIAPGTHEVRFTFEPTGESRGERIVLADEESATIRADFTVATPVIRVSRP
jgi:eukaryotic-like serine/threonine-protein kinase